MTIFYNLSKFLLIPTTVVHVMNSFLTYVGFVKILLRNPGRGVNYAQGLTSGRVKLSRSLQSVPTWRLEKSKNRFAPAHYPSRALVSHHISIIMHNIRTYKRQVEQNRWMLAEANNPCKERRANGTKDSTASR